MKINTKYIKVYRRYFTKAALIWAGCFILFFFIYIFVLAPQKKSKKQLERQLAEKDQIYSSAQKAAQEETKIQLNQQIERLRNKLEDFVIGFEDSANLTFDISQIANEKKVASFNTKNRDKATHRDSEAPDYNYISEDYINISFTAGFNQFAAFLNALERHRPVIFVDKFAIKRSKQKGRSDHKVNMELAFFVRKRQDS